MDLLTSSRGDSASVQVALRIRPQGNREKLDGSKVCTSVIPNEPQVTIGGDRSFTYDNVFDTLAEQTEVYEKCIDKLVEGTFDGFNATVLAYGQTGSGKTYTMGTAFDAGNIPEELIGVVPRAVYHVFRRIGELRAEAADKGIVPPTFDVSVQFIELYNEEILDLLSDDRTSSANIRIHEDVQKNEIYLHGCANRLVSDAHQTLEVLKNGALNRTVAATNMNEQSSRSHAIFTMQIRQQRVAVHGESASSGETELEILTAKFHFVDLAGSERLKRTGATGDRAKEGISINCGLLALGNVISALGGASGKVSHVPYRDSKLTRLLQDSLGGNSRTLMIACVSPSDSDFVETLNTMKYANRAKNIKNKVVANQDKSSKAIGELRARIAQLETELLEYRQGRRTVNGDGLEVVSDQYHENVMLTAEVNQLRFRVKAFQETNEILRGRNVDIQTKLDCAKVGVVLSGDGKDDDAFSNVVRGYVDEVERIRSQLYESQATCEQLRRESTRWKNQAMSGGGMGQSMSMFDSGQAQLIDEARGDVEKLRGRLASIQANDNGETSDYASPLENTEEDATDEGEGDDEEELPDDENPETTALRENLADLQTEINIKERLISELERSERRLSEVRLTYERKLTELSTKIKATEAERDKMLADMVKGSTDKAGEERAKMIRDDYERKLSDMRHEFKKLQMIEREHKRMQARQEVERQQMMRYQSELKDLKKIKVDLVKKIRDEIKRAQQDTMKNAKKIAALDKEARKKDNQIRMLETKDKQREAFMKRTTEEVNRLRKAQRDAQRTASQNARAATRGNAVAKGPLKNQKEMFNPRAAKAKWMAIEKKLMRLVSEKQTVHKMEEELERRISERHTLLDQIIALEKAFVSVQEVAEREAIGEELEGVRAKLRYVQDLIQETQQTIASVDDTTKGEDYEPTIGIENLIEGTSSIPEALYILHHFTQFAVDQATLATRATANQKEAEARIVQLEQQSFINEQLLESVIIDHNIVDEISRVVEAQNRRKTSRTQSRGSSSARANSPSQANGNDDSPLHDYKVRRRTATADELLYPQEGETNGTTNETALLSERSTTEDRHKRRNVVPLPISSSSTHPPGGFARNSKYRSTIGSLPSTSTSSRNSLLGNGQRVQRRANNTALRVVKSTSRLPPLAEMTPIERPERLMRERLMNEKNEKNEKTNPLASSLTSSLTLQSSTSSTSSSFPNRQSVFQRLHPISPDHENSPNFLLNRPLAPEEYKKGRIVSASGGGVRIVKTALLDGHVKPVLSIDGNENFLITGSKDRLAKVWDLERGEEIATLGVHPNNVHAVRFVPNSHLAISASMYQMRVWDLREMKCVRLLQSSGQVVEGDGGSIGSRQNTVPFLETVVNAIEIDPTGELLFSSFCGDVRVWCLSKMASFGRLVGAAHSPRSEVSCLSVAVNPERNVCNVFTGSRDHYVKMYALPTTGEGVHEAAVEFNPPHYDNVTCIVSYDQHIYTASKDMNIMKINLVDNKRDHLELKAHNSYVQGLCLAPLGSETLLASCCKEGTIKLWDVTSTRRMRLVETIEKAHSESINNICHSSGLLFTASSDTTVGVWRPNMSL